MRKTMTLVLAGLLLAGLWAPTADAGKKKKVTESYDVQGLPYPVSGSANGGLGCSAGIEGVHKNTFAFTAPGSGMLDVTLTQFQLDWDLHVLDSNGAVIAQSIGGPDVATERIVVPLKAKAEVGVVACNWSGTPTAHVDLVFTY